MDRTEVVEVEFPDGSVGYAEVAVPARRDVAERRTRWRVEDLGADIRRTTRWLVEEVRSALPDRPQTVGVEFGLKLSTKTGRLTSVLAEVGAEATVVVKVQWEVPGPDAG